MLKIYPSILSADFGILKEELKELERSGADGVHIDVMDGHFVNNISFGIPVLKSIRKYTKMFLDVHLMIQNPEKYIKAFCDAGSDAITFHVEAVNNVLEVISEVKKLGIKAGVSIKPATEIPDIKILSKIDSILVMSVEPGFGGQKYIESADLKIQELKKIKDMNNLKFEIIVDGGINFDNAMNVKNNGADVLVAGSAVFNANNKFEAIKRLKYGNTY